MKKFDKFNKNSQAFYDLIRVRPTAFVLLALIATRARGSDDLASGLEVGEALIGDYEIYGVTRRQYRTDLNYLKTTSQITVKTTNKGTIAKLVSTDIFDILKSSTGQQVDQQNDHREAIKRPLTKSDREKKPSYRKASKQGKSKNEVWNEVAPTYLKEKAINDPKFIARVKESYLNKAKSSSPSAVRSFINFQLTLTPPEEYFNFDSDFPSTEQIEFPDLKRKEDA